MLLEMGKAARAAARLMARAAAELKNRALEALARGLVVNSSAILEANCRDVAGAHASNMAPHLVDRLLLNEGRLDGMASDLRDVARLPDPVGEVFDQMILPNGLSLRKQRVPLGVLGVIYEARPNVTVDVAGLVLKSGNAVILRGGSEALYSNRVLTGITRETLASVGLPADAVQFVDSPGRELILDLLHLSDYVDLIIPRGGNSLHDFCRQNSRIPVATGGSGICHLFVDEHADLPRALEVIHNAKTQRPSVCNALDTLLVHRAVADGFLAKVVEHLRPAGVTFRADETALLHLTRRGPLPEGVRAAGPQDFDTEWLSLILGMKVVDSLEAAVAHIAAHSTGHSDGILTGDLENARRFVAEVDSAAVYVNASTRFTDGGQFGLGAEVAVSTQRLHARGPMGLRELTTYKWVVEGDYHVRP